MEKKKKKKTTTLPEQFQNVDRGIIDTPNTNAWSLTLLPWYKH